MHGNGDGTFAAPKSFSVPILNRYQIASTVDLSGDGKLDLVVSVIGASMVEVMLATVTAHLNGAADSGSV